jgi:hypothetical protein
MGRLRDLVGALAFAGAFLSAFFTAGMISEARIDPAGRAMFAGCAAITLGAILLTVAMRGRSNLTRGIAIVVALVCLPCGVLTQIASQERFNRDGRVEFSELLAREHAELAASGHGLADSELGADKRRIGTVEAALKPHGCVGIEAWARGLFSHHMSAIACPPAQR